MLDKIDLQILKVIFEAMDPISSSQIASLIGKSSRTVRDRLKKIQDALEDHGAVVAMKPGVGIELSVHDERAFSHFMSRYKLVSEKHVENIEKDLRVLIQHLIQARDYIKSDDLSMRLLVSRSKLTVLFNELRKILKQYDLDLESKPHHGVKIVGTEINLRRFISSYYVQDNWFASHESLSSEYYEGFDEFNMIEHEIQVVHRISELVGHEIEMMQYTMPTAVFKSLVIHLFITVKRIREGMHLNVSSELVIQEKTSLEFTLANRLIERIEAEFGTPFPEYEHTYIAMHLIGKKVLKENEQRTIPPEINQLVEDILKEIKANKNIDLLDDFDLRMMLGLHLVPLISRIKYGIELKNPILEEVKAKCIAGYDLAIVCCRIINDTYNTELSEHEVSYFAIHFDVALLKRQEKSEKKRVLIVCSSGRASAQLLKMKFEQLFNEYINYIVVCELIEVQHYLETDSFDYIFSTIPITLDIDFPTPVFEFSFFLDELSVRKIESVLSSDHQENDISQFFDERLFFGKLELDNREAILGYMARASHAVHDLPENFEALIWERELFTGTDILAHTALPHPARVVSEETFVSVAILEKPILWATKLVQIVFLVSISKHESEKYKMLLEKIVEITTSPNRLERIISQGTYDGLMNEIRKI